MSPGTRHDDQCRSSSQICLPPRTVTNPGPGLVASTDKDPQPREQNHGSSRLPSPLVRGILARVRFTHINQHPFPPIPPFKTPRILACSSAIAAEAGVTLDMDRKRSDRSPVLRGAAGGLRAVERVLVFLHQWTVISAAMEIPGPITRRGSDVLVGTHSRAGTVRNSLVFFQLFWVCGATVVWPHPSPRRRSQSPCKSLRASLPSAI